MCMTHLHTELWRRREERKGGEGERGGKGKGDTKNDCSPPGSDAQCAVCW